jgi:hypothetical protein
VAFLTPQRFTDKLVMRKPAQLANLIELRIDLRRKARIAGIATISAMILFPFAWRSWSVLMCLRV